MKESKEYVIINNEVTIKPYFYVRNALLHCRYTVDRAILLTENEKNNVVTCILDVEGKEKQKQLLKCWKSLELEKTVIQDGIREVELRYIPSKKIY